MLEFVMMRLRKRLARTLHQRVAFAVVVIGSSQIHQGASTWVDAASFMLNAQYEPWLQWWIQTKRLGGSRIGGQRVSIL